jgi:hypothetical protein
MYDVVVDHMILPVLRGKSGVEIKMATTQTYHMIGRSYMMIVGANHDDFARIRRELPRDFLLYACSQYGCQEREYVRIEGLARVHARTLGDLSTLSHITIWAQKITPISRQEYEARTEDAHLWFFTSCAEVERNPGA